VTRYYALGVRMPYWLWRRIYGSLVIVPPRERGYTPSLVGDELRWYAGDVLYDELNRPAGVRLTITPPDKEEP
jgi:hypothetical protein